MSLELASRSSFMLLESITGTTMIRLSASMITYMHVSVSFSVIIVDSGISRDADAMMMIVTVGWFVLCLIHSLRPLNDCYCG